MKTTQAAGSEKNSKVLRLQSNGKIKPLLFCGIKPGGSVWCGAKNSNTEIHTHEGFREKTQKLQCFFKIVFTPLCIHIFMSGTLHDKREK